MTVQNISILFLCHESIPRGLQVLRSELVGGCSFKGVTLARLGTIAGQCPTVGIVALRYISHPFKAQNMPVCLSLLNLFFFSLNVCAGLQHLCCLAFLVRVAHYV